MSRNIMKRLRPALAAVIALALVIAPAAALAVPSGTPAAPTHSAGQFLVKFRPGTPAATVRAINAANRVSQKAAIERIDVRVLTVPPGKTAEELVARYAKNPNVEFAEVDALAQATLTPNDSLYPRQWAPSYVNAPAAWDLTTGGTAVTIAILDTGLELTHPELAGRIVPGYDFVNGDADPSDDHGHGTRVTGIAAATGNNTAGVAGMDWRARVMPVKVLDATGSGAWSVVASGLVHAADRGAQVINMSLGGPASSTLQSAIRYAYGKGCTLVAATGNEGSDIARYPAAYPEVIAVGSVYRDVVSTFSNYGSHVGVVAPGETIDSIAPGGGYGRISGTSAASPFVAGLAALLHAAKPGLTPSEAHAAITTTARDLGSPGWDELYGWGHIDAAAALAAVSSGTPVPGPGVPDTEPVPEPEPVAPQPEPGPAPEPAPSDSTAPSVAIVSPSPNEVVSGLVTVVAEASDDVSVVLVKFYVNGALIGSAESGPYSVNWNTKKLAGPYALTAIAYDAAGNSASSATVNVTVGEIVRKPPPRVK